ncbi:hypothetical protein ACF3M2_14225 [Tissierella carlieri]|uniref:hypothetical protein n=1 Tax=Tissierella carlieri TaxID=689904 RepID=UPI0038679C5A
MKFGNILRELLVAVFQRLDKYFSKETKEIINAFIINVDGYTSDQEDYLIEVKEQIDRLNTKLHKIKNLSFQSLKDVDKVIEVVKSYKIDLSYFHHINSESTQEKIKIINSSLDDILDKAGILQGKINKQKKLVENTIKEHKKEIDDFLINAGYNYRVDILEEENGSYKLKLIPNDYNKEIDNARLHLSFGERNAFALVLFMYDVLKNGADLVILDDPISSFDKNKKYAIIDMLFKRNRSLKDKTVLLLTHDFDPILDMVHHHRDRFDIPRAYFLENDKGNLTEKEILRENIKTFLDILKDNIVSAKADINRLIYLRRFYELNDNRGIPYELLSNLFHKRETPIYGNSVCCRVYKDSDCCREIKEPEIDSATKKIRKYIPGFEYSKFIDLINDTSIMIDLYNKSESNYEKLQIYRIINDGQKCNDIIQKFINETFHIDNDYIYQLNPCNYQTIPQYIIDECDKNIKELQVKLQPAY